MLIKFYLILFVIKINLLLTEESFVVPISEDLTKNATIPEDENSVLSATVHLNTNKYGLTTWWQKHFANQTQRYLDFKGFAQSNILTVADEAMALAVSLKTGIYNETHTGVKREVALNVTVRMITSLASCHKSNAVHGWGYDWQSALWAYYTGLGAWLLWDHIKDQQDRNYIENMIIHESDRFITFEVPYYQDKNGKVLHPGDTKGEENGWDSQVLQLSTSMMPKHPNWKKWMHKMLELMVSAYSRPSDLKSTKVLNGKEVKEWLNGSNIFENGSLVNHNRIHPDYMQCIAYLLGAPNTFALAGMPTPEAAFFNDEIVYGALVGLNFPSPPYHKPGGTMYVKSADGKEFTGDIYYPEGDDWGTGSRMQFTALDSIMSKFTKHGEKYHSEQWQKAHVKEVLRMQSRFPDGHTYANKQEFNNPIAEEWVASWSTFNYLTRWVAHNFKIVTTNESYQ